MTDSNEQVVSEISLRIQQLESFSTEDLKPAMQELKKALLENPAACLLLKEEDIGLLVTHLRKITGVAIASASSKTKTPKEKKETTKKLSAEELAAALDDI